MRGSFEPMNFEKMPRKKCKDGLWRYDPGQDLDEQLNELNQNPIARWITDGCAWIVFVFVQFLIVTYLFFKNLGGSNGIR